MGFEMLLAAVALAGADFGSPGMRHVPDMDASMAATISTDAYPAIGVAGDPASIDAVEAHAARMGWTSERLVRSRISVFLGERPRPEPVAEFLHMLRTGEFGSARNVGITLRGPVRIDPTTPPSSQDQRATR